MYSNDQKKCPICGKNCYVSEKSQDYDYACSDPDCEFCIGYNAYMEKNCFQIKHSHKRFLS